MVFLVDIPTDHRRRVGYHSAAWLLAGVFQGGVIGYLAFTARRLGASPTMIGALVSSQLVASLVAPVYVHRIAHVPSLSLVALLRAGAAVIVMLIALATSDVSFVVIGMVAWFVLQSSSPFYGQLLSELYPPGLRGRLQVVPMIALMMGVAMASLVVGRLLNIGEHAYRSVLPLAALFGIASSIILLRTPMPRSRPDSVLGGFLDCFHVALSNGKFLTWTIVYSFTTIGFWIVYTSLPVYLNDVLRLDNFRYGVTQAASSVAMVAGFFAWGGYIDRRGAIPAMFLGWLLAGSGIAMIVLGSSFLWAVFGQALNGFGMAANELAWFPVAIQYAPENRVKSYMGFYLAAYGIRGIVGAGLASYLMDGLELSSTLSLAAGACPMILGACAIFALRRAMAP